jgi:tetratricopeptide (TPR) repeat protein
VLERVHRAFPQSWDVNYNLAIAYFQTAQYDQAADLIGPFTGTQGKAEAFALLGAIEEKRKRTLEAERALEDAVAREPSSEDYRFDYGNSLVQHGKFASGVAVFRKAAADLPQSWKLRMGLGSAYYLTSDYENAARTLLEAVNLNPSSPIGWHLVGEAYESATPSLQQEIETAFASYLKTRPHDAAAYYHYAAMLYKRAQTDGRNDYQQAIQNVNDALRLNPNFAEAHFELGLIALAQGKMEQSIAALQKAVSLEPELAAAHYRLGLAYKRVGNETRAQEELSRFRALKEDERQRDHLLHSLAAIAANEPRSPELP